MTTFLNNSVTLGHLFEVGDKASDAKLLNTDLETKSLSDFKGLKVISVIPSIDTGICSTQTRTFNKELAEKDNVSIITVSEDLPFAQKKWCANEGIENALILSDYKDHDFGKNYGLLMQEWQLLARAVLILDDDLNVLYTQYVENVNSEPNYQEVIDKVNELM